MHIKYLTLFMMVLTWQNSVAETHSHEHGGQIFHSFTLTAGAGVNSDGDNQQNWDFDGWIGTDDNKLWLKSEGERLKNSLEKAEFSAYYSRNISTFWDAQIGLRYDTKPDSLGYLALGFEGLAPYFFETSAHLFVSEEGDVSARLHIENESLFTQRLILQPFLEINAQAQDVPEAHLSAGLTDAELGLQLRYEVTRTFAPYAEVKYARKFGDNATHAEHHGESRGETVGTLGIRFLF